MGTEGEKGDSLPGFLNGVSGARCAAPPRIEGAEEPHGSCDLEAASSERAPRFAIAIVAAMEDRARSLWQL